MNAVKKLFLVGIVATILGMASVASATAQGGYVCKTTWIPGANSYGWGESGYISVSFYTGPDCSGSYLGYKYLCSENASVSSCADNDAYLLTGDNIGFAFETLVQARIANLPVTIVTGNCASGGTTNCLLYTYMGD